MTVHLRKKDGESSHSTNVTYLRVQLAWGGVECLGIVSLVGYRLMFSVSGQGRSVGRSKMYGNSGSLVVSSKKSEKISMVKSKGVEKISR